MISIIKFAGFIGAFLLILLGAHYWLFSTVMRFFPIGDPGIRKTALWVMVFLALSFFPSAILVRLHFNIITHLFYHFSCIWLGFFLHLLMALVLIWAVFGAGKLLGFAPDMRMVVIGFFLLAWVVSLYGMWQARNPIIKRIEVEIKGLPDHWRGRTIVHLSDVHLGAIQKASFMYRVAEKVNSVNPDLILITGDLFDGMGGDLSSFIQPLNSLKAPLGIFFVTGNHEGYLGLARPLSILEKTAVRVLDNEIVDLKGLQIIGINFPEHDRRNDARKLLAASGSYDPDKPSILLYHTPTNIAEYHTDRGSQQVSTYWFPDTSMKLAKERGIDLQLSGHTHRGQLFPFGMLARAIYHGYEYGLHTDGDFHLYVSSGVGTWGPPMRTEGSSEIVLIQLH